MVKNLFLRSRKKRKRRISIGFFTWNFGCFRREQGNWIKTLKRECFCTEKTECFFIFLSLVFNLIIIKRPAIFSPSACTHEKINWIALSFLKLFADFKSPARRASFDRRGNLKVMKFKSKIQLIIFLVKILSIALNNGIIRQQNKAATIIEYLWRSD